MGYFPVVIALLAFVVLLFLVNLSSIRNRQGALGLALFHVCQTARSRQTLLRAIREIPLNERCPDLPQRLKNLPQAIPGMTGFLEAERRSVNELEFLLQDKNFSESHAKLLPPLQVLNQRQHINLRTFERKVREYNQLLESTPTSLVARLWQIKPISLVAVRR